MLTLTCVLQCPICCAITEVRQRVPELLKDIFQASPHLDLRTPCSSHPEAPLRGLWIEESAHRSDPIC